MSRVDVWEIPLVVEAETLQAIAARLNPTERERANRLIHPEHGRRKMASQWATREILSWYLECPPEEVDLEVEPDGKPRLCEPVWHFNLSHSEEWALLAVAREELGVDVEYAGREIECNALARRFFSSLEADRVAALRGAEQLSAFFQIWTLKEAYVKATGKGLRLPLDNFRVFEQTDWGLYRLDGAPLAGWFGRRLETVLQLPATYRAALVTPQAAPELHRHRYLPFIRVS